MVVLLAAVRRPGTRLTVFPSLSHPRSREDWLLAVRIATRNLRNSRKALNLKGFEGSGADWLEIYKPLINDGKTIVTSPHKVYGPETNDLVLQLRKRKIDTVLLGGMSANLCTESHMRELLEQGFEVIVVKDATAAAISPDLGDGYQSALTNFGFMANGVITTDEAVAKINGK